MASEGVVVSDLEGTLTRGRTMPGIGRYCFRHGRSLRFMGFLVLQYFKSALVILRLMDSDKYANQGLADLAKVLSGMTADELHQMSIWVVDHELWPKRFSMVLAELEDMKRQGCEIILNSGTFQPVLEVFAKRIGAKAIGTPLEVKDNRVTGYLPGPANRKEVKVDRLGRSFPGVLVEHSYSNGLDDLPILELSKASVVINPNKKLQKIAQQHGWRIISAN